MQLIVGHTTHDSAWIWVRGDRKNRRLEVELETLPCADCDSVRSVEPVRVKVDSRRDYTGVACFDQVLRPNTPYRVRLRSHPGFHVVADPSFREVEGRLRTFAAPEEERPFQFLHGSCNLSNARLIALGSMAVGVFGGMATDNSIKRPVTQWYSGHDLRWALRALGWPGIRRLTRWSLLVHGWMSRATVYVTTYLTRFEQPNPSNDQKLPTPQLPSPFAKLVDEIEGFDHEEAKNRISEEEAATRPEFMIHAGDQIYFDVDFPKREARKEHYRRNYRQAWFQDESTKRMLTLLPNYMILDDHEIVENFGTDSDEAETKQLEPALDAYDEYVSARQPQHRHEPGQRRHEQHKGYHFAHGDTGFFVLDTRTKRSTERGEMIAPAQLAELENWLRGKNPYRPYKLRFIVSSVPFVAQLRPPGFDRNGKRTEEKQADRWSGPAWQRQRESIIELIYEHEVERLVFLVGDMHCAYHATMRIGLPNRSFTIHELAGGPINQLLFASRDDFYARFNGRFTDTKSGQELPWVSTLEAFHGAAPSVLRISVTPQSVEKRTPLDIHWRVERTRSPVDERPRSQIISILEEVDSGRPRGVVCREHGISVETFYRWKLQEERKREEKKKKDGANRSESTAEGSETLAAPDPDPLCGRIRFHRQREEWL